MKKSYDLIVIGSGVGGSSVATACNQKGWSVAIIDDRPFGGTCALRGCDPKKVLHGIVNIYDEYQRIQGKGLTGDLQINWNELMQFKKKFTEPVPENREDSWNEVGIDTYRGKAIFLDENQIQIGEYQLRGTKIVLATGSMPTPLPIYGIEHLSYSDDFLELENLPKTIVFVGGGYISFEFAHMAARAGATVHILHRGDRPLKKFDPDLVDTLLEKSKEIGIQVHLNHAVKGIKKDGENFIVEAEYENKTISFVADKVVHGAGRIPMIDMDLEKGNVQYSKKGIKVNDHLQSPSNPRVYAVGDVLDTEGFPLTPVAGFESGIVVANLQEERSRVIHYPVTPSVVFTVPKLAMIGMSEKEAQNSAKNIEVNHQKLSTWFTYRRTNEKYAEVKVIRDKDTDQILGAHVLGEGADDLINHFTTAIQLGITTEELKQVVYAYPTAASNIEFML
ncbi:dihydrolipoyl dehydrogenase family protein [Lacticigenium naphthae]|uniref:dihydrolipoyl dehydrogenase family protein n=1 Tax=Lacticigenium naphthae TaxID=515351 RepID=UPI000406F16C|nr:NAD(P)/FAD-dependent oxidoreductase [Lacticigenium naphthae]